MVHKQNIAPTAVKIDPLLKARLTKLSEDKEHSIHWLIIKAIECYVIAEEQAEQLKQETLARWQEAEKDHIVNHESVVEWLKIWGTEKEKQRPSCE